MQILEFGARVYAQVYHHFMQILQFVLVFLLNDLPDYLMIFDEFSWPILTIIVVRDGRSFGKFSRFFDFFENFMIFFMKTFYVNARYLIVPLMTIAAILGLLIGNTYAWLGVILFGINTIIDTLTLTIASAVHVPIAPTQRDPPFYRSYSSIS